MNICTKGSRLRPGLAPIELLMTLPLFAVLFLMLLTASAGGMLMFEINNRARNDAWKSRNEVAQRALLEFPIRGKTAKEICQIFDAETSDRRPAVAKVCAGKVAAEAEGRLKIGFEPILQMLPNVQRQHTLMIGTWDHREIDFEDKAKHKRLKLERRIIAFSSDDLKLDVFEHLLPHK